MITIGKYKAKAIEANLSIFKHIPAYLAMHKTRNSVKTSIMIESKQIRNSSCEKLLGVFFDSKLTFHIDNIFKKASQKLNAIPRITPYMDSNKKRLAVIPTTQYPLLTINMDVP